MNRFTYLMMAILLLGVMEAGAYNPRRTNTFSSYKEHAHEIGYGINLSYLRYEKSWAPQLHFHYTRYLTNYFALGLGYGSIYDEHFHQNLHLEFSVRFYKSLVLSLKPGIAYKTQNSKGRFLYAMGFETSYEFPLNDKIHIGPMLEIDYFQDDVAYLAGFHMGFTF
ncbi:MAG: hypothetical protein JXR22_08920 [Prolixibacteraceae bacterium]|nr:hypothetical protein [Prolixibacteraceae bacterium]